MRHRRCALCGAYLDPSEWCDCEDTPADDVDEWEARRPLRGRQLSLDDLLARHLKSDSKEGN